MSDRSPQPSTSNALAAASSTDSKAVVPKKKTVGSRAIVLSAEHRPVKLIKKPRVMLDEEEFTTELEKIIVRDYFPEVPKLRVSSFH